MTDGIGGSPTKSKVLEGILEAKREEVAALSKIPCTTRAPGPRRSRIVQGLARGRGEPLRLVTEIKRRSPSAGALSTVLSVADRALAYARGGAAMISVLCDAPFFDGGFHHVIEARTALDAAGLGVPILAKEFIIDERQLEEAAACGADAVLLIARIVEPPRLSALLMKGRELGLATVVEVVTEDELRVALDATAKVIGVNARDLDTLAMDPARAARVLAAIPDDCVAIHLSGLKSDDDVAAVAQTDADAALIGEALMRQDDPSSLLASMITSAAK